MAMVCNTQLESLCRDPAAVRVRLNEFMGSLAAELFFFFFFCLRSLKAFKWSLERVSMPSRGAMGRLVTRGRTHGTPLGPG